MQPFNPQIKETCWRIGDWVGYGAEHMWGIARSAGGKVVLEDRALRDNLLKLNTTPHVTSWEVQQSTPTSLWRWEEIPPVILARQEGYNHDIVVQYLSQAYVVAGVLRLFARDLLFSYYPTGFKSDPVICDFLWGNSAKSITQSRFLAGSCPHNAGWCDITSNVHLDGAG